jgi:ketopantoate reductase
MKLAPILSGRFMRICIFGAGAVGSHLAVGCAPATGFLRDARAASGGRAANLTSRGPEEFKAKVRA